jgi:hypothetical protein
MPLLMGMAIPIRMARTARTTRISTIVKALEEFLERFEDKAFVLISIIYHVEVFSQA